MVTQPVRGSKEWQAGLTMLKRPIWPLVNLLEILWLTGEFKDLRELLKELPNEIEMDHGVYKDPCVMLAPYEDLVERILNLEESSAPTIRKGSSDLSKKEACEAYFKQRIIERELESINSLLCSPVGCNLCCIGPTEGEKNLFFEIPLEPGEVQLFKVDTTTKTEESIKSTPYEEPPLVVDGTPFYEKTPRIIIWSHGPSLILGRGTRCPNLSPDNRCVIYGSRPNTCRRPQIFAYVIEKARNRPGYALENKLLAISDCPYVRELKQEIHFYASCSGLDLVITSNRA